MARMDPRIPMAGQQPNFLRTLAQSNVAASQANAVRDENDMRNLFRTRGPEIMAGDPDAMNALARRDPSAALGITESRDLIDQRRAAARREAERFAMSKSAAEVEAEREQLEQGLKQAIRLHQTGDLDTLNRYLMQNGIIQQPLRSLDEFPAIAAPFGDALETLEKVRDFNAPMSGPGKVYADIQSGNLPEGTELRSPQVVVNTGDGQGQRPIVDKPPKGYQRRWDEENQTYVDEPIVNSEVERERSKEERGIDLAMADYDRKFNIVDSNIDKALNLLEQGGRWVAGYGSLLSGLPESDARDFKATLDTVKANLGFEELQAMRDASPTGGALGQISEREIAFLQAIQGNLDAAQSPEQLEAVLREIKQRRAEFAEQRRRIMEQDQGTTDAQDQNESPVNLPGNIWNGMTESEIRTRIQEGEPLTDKEMSDLERAVEAMQ